MARAVRRGDLWMAATVLTLTLLAFGLRALSAQEAHTLTITTPTETRTLRLAADTTLTLTGRDGLTVTVAVQDGAARVCAADCPDQVCVHTGRLSRAGATAACVPAGVLLQIGGETEVDAVAG